MAFNIMAKYGDSIPTCKGTEKVVVQHVEVTDRTGNNPQHRVEARIMVDSDNYTGPSKTVIGFADVESLEDFAYALLTAADDARTALESNKKVKKVSPAQADEAPVKKVVRKRVARSTGTKKSA